MTSDTIVGIVGAVVLTGAMIVVFVYEKDQVAGGGGAVGTGNETFDISWEKATMNLSFTGARLTPAQSASGNFEVPAYATHIHVRVTWTDDMPGTMTPVGGQSVGGPDQFSSALANTTDAEVGAATAGGSPREIAHPIPANDDPPANTTALGDTAQDAVAAINADLATQNLTAMGNWTYTVTLTATGDESLPEAARQDTGNTYTVEVMIDYWKPVATLRE